MDGVNVILGSGLVNVVGSGLFLGPATDAEGGTIAEGGTVVEGGVAGGGVAEAPIDCVVDTDFVEDS